MQNKNILLIETLTTIETKMKNELSADVLIKKTRVHWDYLFSKIYDEIIFLLNYGCSTKTVSTFLFNNLEFYYNTKVDIEYCQRKIVKLYKDKK